MKQTFRFHTGARVTARSFADAFNRDAQPRLASPATAYMREIVGAAAVIDGKAQSISGVRVLGRYRLQIRLTRQVPDFTARLSMPFFCPILPHTPITELDTPAGSGPYYVHERILNQRIVLKRNPYYRGERPANVDEVVLTFTKLRGLRGRRRAGPHRLLLPRYRAACRNAWPRGTASTGPAGSSSSALRSALVRRRSTTTGPRSGGRVRSRSQKAINYAIDRPEIARKFGYLGGKPTDQMLPPALARPASIYPLKGADPATARKWLARATIKPSTLVLYANNTPQGVAIAQTLVYNLKQIGIDVQVKYFYFSAVVAKVAAPGEPFDLALTGWIADYADPASFFVPLLYRGSALGRQPRRPTRQRANRGGEPPERRGTAQGLGRPRRRPDARQPTLGAACEPPDPHVRLAEPRLRARPPPLQVRHRRRLQETMSGRLSLSLAMLAAGVTLLVAAGRDDAHATATASRGGCFVWLGSTSTSSTRRSRTPGPRGTPAPDLREAVQQPGPAR